MNYDEYARLFDKVFPLNKATLAFLTEEFEGKTKILDLCCGRGLYTNALSERFDVSGIDLSPEMIASAREQFPSLPFSVGDMRDFGGEYDGIFIIGNSLVHLTDLNEIENEIGFLSERLTPGGKLVVQIINYDRIYKFNLPGLPEINRDGIRFVREYELYDGKTVFNSTLYYEGSQSSQSVVLYPLKSTQLFGALSRAGLANIRAYGGFDRREFAADESMQLVVTAEKRA